ncbi:unnamed protein product [Soboliphyme baturini]|uniref:DHC_N1 domain-containing protein n=1 Tax=Soboliphyme baturini TaxID=241478 RepID=A0A183JAA5_9BILA|nr:unnamed protein product [Soboliphyme baturini]
MQVAIERSANLGESIRNEEWLQTLKLYTELSDFVNRFESTACIRLKEWLTGVRYYWSTTLLNVVSGKIEHNILKTALSLSDAPSRQAIFGKTNESQLLCRLVLLVAGEEALAEIVARPFRKRFLLYFCGGEAGSDAKPEWYFKVSLYWRSAGVQWLSDVSCVGSKQLTRLLAAFSKNMIEIVQQKLKTDLDETLRNNDVIKLSQLIDDAVSFDTRLQGRISLMTWLIVV